MIISIVYEKCNGDRQIYYLQKIANKLLKVWNQKLYDFPTRLLLHEISKVELVDAVLNNQSQKAPDRAEI